MSARFFKILALVAGAHLVLLFVIWIGFPIPYPRPPATFTYAGALPAPYSGQAREIWPKGDALVPSELDHFDASGFKNWIELRDLAKH